MFGCPAALVGHSMGGVAAALAVQAGVSSDSLVLINSPANAIDQLDRFARLLRIGLATQVAVVTRLERTVGRRMDEFDLRTRAAPDLPILIVHDQDDREVPYGEAQVLLQAWPKARLVTSDRPRPLPGPARSGDHPDGDGLHRRHPHHRVA